MIRSSEKRSDFVFMISTISLCFFISTDSNDVLIRLKADGYSSKLQKQDHAGKLYHNRNTNLMIVFPCRVSLLNFPCI